MSKLIGRAPARFRDWHKEGALYWVAVLVCGIVAVFTWCALDGSGGALAGLKDAVITSEHLSAAFHHPIHGVTLDGERFFRAGRLNGTSA